MGGFGSAPVGNLQDYVNQWVDTVPGERDPYWFIVREVARRMESDGCTGVADFHCDACYEHDIHWRTGKTITGLPLTTAQANRRFRKVIQSRSTFGRFSPMSWWRWLGVTIGAQWISHKTT
jgi:hypothetical protein